MSPYPFSLNHRNESFDYIHFTIYPIMLPTRPCAPSGPFLLPLTNDILLPCRSLHTTVVQTIYFIFCEPRYDYTVSACLLVLLNDFMDHLDGIVAKAQRKVYGNVDSPLLGAFVDAFCDKVRHHSICYWIRRNRAFLLHLFLITHRLRF